ncbi:eukaryotic translation initiation factor 4b/4h [Holotrichia oblita]|uniref:Eukaryotic translation initiation factor 4b/4h n=2 Tax=Holotrichia oblita TaxID=644536 RepID=A0ACB9SZ92_HOLOL|nr:eukaryotic translation initiation factor 4b/4h [Holotrichia oblita]KAI4459888.1 eukaryotic translation initiation factor 4b/4h [Holotrichia oblita]
MASSGKKGKKSKGKTLALTDFLQETPGPAPTLPIRKNTLNWAEEVENSYDSYESRPKANVVLPTAPKAARGLDDYSDKVPQKPPYMAYLSNLPYDVSENEIAEFFENLKITNMRIPKDDKPGEQPKLKGFGYVEFADREGLLEALAITDCTIKGRRIRIEVASNSENERRRGGRMDMGRDRGDRSDIMSDWRSRTESADSDRRLPPPNRERERDRDRDSMSSWRDASDRPSFREDRFNRDGERKGFDRDNDRRGGFDRDGDRRGFDSDRRGFNRDGRRGFGPRSDDRNGGFNRGSREDPPERNEPRERPKLNLKPRSIPLEETATVAPAQEKEAEPSAVPSSKIFGEAKPVDTTARERQIEEILAKESFKTTLPRDEKRREGDRSPRRTSPERRRFSPRRVSPDRRKRSPERKRFSPERKRYSPERRRNSPERRRNSPERKRVSPDRRRYSPERRRNSPDRRRNSPERRRGSPDRRRSSPERRRVSPERRERKISPPDRKDSPPRRRRSSDRSDSQKSPDYKSNSPDRKKKSPTRRRGSRSPPRGGGPGRRNEGDARSDKPQQREKEKPKREREMPKLKEPEPPNFVGSNKYAFLPSDDDSNY